MRTWSWQGPVSFMVLTAGLSACAFTGQGTSTNSASSMPKPDPRPRFEGKWRVTYTPRDGDQGPERVAWKVAPACPQGACAILIRSSNGNRFRLSFDLATGVYEANDVYRRNCSNPAVGKVAAQKAYRNRVISSYGIAKSVSSAEGRVATEIFGVRRTPTTLKPSANGKCEPDVGVKVESVRGVRIDAPARG